MYSFDSKCPFCEHNESIELRIPLYLPTNRYPSDFKGIVKITTSQGNDVDIKFITVAQDIDCENLTRNRIAKKLISKDDYDIDYSNSRTAYHIAAVNKGKPDSLQEVRDWLNSIPISERKEINEFISKIAPGVSYNVQITCEECGKDYERLLPIGADFFRPRTVHHAEQLPRGVRIGVLGEDELSEFTPSSRETVPDEDSGRSGKRDNNEQ